MAIDPGAFNDRLDYREDRIEAKRTEKAKAFAAYKDAKIKAGEVIDPYELDRVRLSMTAGDPYLSTYIPAGDALNEMTRRANEASSLSRSVMQKDLLDTSNLKREAVQTYIDNNSNKNLEILKKDLAKNFGPEVYAEYEPEVISMKTNARNKKIATYMTDPATMAARDETELEVLHGGRDMPYFEERLIAWQKTNRANIKADAATIGATVDKMPYQAVDLPGAKDSLAQQVGWSTYDEAPDEIKRSIDNMTSFRKSSGVMVDYKTRADQLTGVVVEQLAEIEKNRAASVDGTLEARFGYDPKFMFKKKGSTKTEIDPRIQEIFARLKTTSGFLPSEENLDMAAVIINQAWGENGKGFEAAVILEKILAHPDIESAADWTDFRKESLLNDEFGIPPGKHIPSYMAQEKAAIDTEIQDILDYMPNRPLEDSRREVGQLAFDIKALENGVMQAYSDPSIRATQTGWNLQSHLADIAEMKSFLQQAQNALAVKEANALEDQAKQAEAEAANPQADPNQPYENPTWGRYQPQPGDTRGNVLWQRGVVDPAQVIGGTARAVTGISAAELAGESINKGLKKAGEYLSQPYYAPPPTEPIEGTIEFTDERPVKVENQPLMIRGAVDEDQQNPFGNLMTKIKYLESNGDPKAQAKTSSALGLYQFTKGTWDNMVRKHGARYGITEADRGDPNAQHIMMQLLMKENAQYLLNATDKVPNEVDIYMAHFLGAPQAAKMINNIGTNQLAAHLFPDAAAANRSLFYKDGMPVTIEQLYETMSRKMTKVTKRVEQETYDYNDRGEPV